MGSGEDAQFVFAKYDYTAQGNQELDMRRYEIWIKYQIIHLYTDWHDLNCNC